MILVVVEASSDSSAVRAPLGPGVLLQDRL